MEKIFKFVYYNKIYLVEMLHHKLLISDEAGIQLYQIPIESAENEKDPLIKFAFRVYKTLIA